MFIFRSGEMLQTLEFSRILHSSTFNSMAVQARIKQNKDTLTVLFLSNLDNQIKMASIKILDDDNRRRVKAEKGTVNVISNEPNFAWLGLYCTVNFVEKCFLMTELVS